MEWISYIYYNLKTKTMYSLKCNYYEKEFRWIDELLRDVLDSGMDPNYEITFNGKPTGETAWDLIGPEA
jgi:hypothetical protein